MKNYYTYFIFFYCLLNFTLLPIGVFAQNCEKPWKLSPVCGQIIDFDTGLPIAGAQIIGDPTCPISTTNSNTQGFYCLNLNCCSVCQNFPPIRYNNFVTVKASGYCLIRVRPISGHIDSLNFYLSRNCNCTRSNDSLVLVQMSNALNLNWPITQPLSNSDAWGGGSPGMFFSENLCVTGINMKPGYGVIANGILPTAFSTLTALEEFDSEGNDTRFLSGTLPDMSNFKNLNNFRLRKSKMTGGLPASLGKLKNLSSLIVIENPELRGTIPSELGNLRELGTLHLFANNLTGTIPTELGNLKKLFDFNIFGNNLNGTLPTGFRTCDSLRHFFVDNCGNLTGRDEQIDFMFRLPKIQYLSLAGNKFSGTMPKVPATPVNFNLSFINLNDNQFDSLPPLTCQRFLLSVKNNKLTFDDILPNLTYVNSAGQNCVTDFQYSITGYAPQDSIGSEKTIIATIGSTITVDELKIDAGVADNDYQWYKNGSIYGNVLHSNKLVIPNFTAADTGMYICRVTNPRAPLLTLNSRKITIKVVSCIASTPSVNAVIQPICTVATGSVVLNGLPSTGTWTLTRSPDNVTTTGTGESTTITGLAVGTYTYIVTNSLGCASLASNNIVLNAVGKPETPIIGTITQPTCAISVSTVAISNLPAVGTWTLTRNPSAVTSTGTGTATTVSGLPAGTYTFTVTNAASCMSSTTSSIVINASPARPSAPLVENITMPPCDSTTGSVLLSGLPATGTWTLNPTGEKGTGTSTTVKKLAEGTYTFTVTNSEGCTSSPSIVVITCKKTMEEKCLKDLINQIPNGFTPGGNGVNDYFDPEKYIGIGGCSSNVKAEELYIVNRWGEMIFKAQPYEKWDGRSSNQQRIAPTSSYYYILVLKVGDVNKSIKGVINLFAD